MPVAFPQNAPPVRIPHLPDVYRWTDVLGYTVNLAQSLFDSVLGGTEQIADSVKSYVLNALSAAQTTWSSFVQWNMMLTLSTFDDVTATIQTVEGYAISNFAEVFDDILNIETFIANAGWVTADWVLGGLSEVERWVVDGIDQAVNDLKTWVWDDVVNPAVTALERVIEAVRDEAISGIDTLRDDITGLINTETLERLAAIAGVWAAIQALTDFVDECGQPMCDSMGPGTDLGKALQALKGLLGLLAGFAIADLTEQQLEHFAQVFASISGTDLEGLVSGFVEQNETVGQAAGAVLGDIGDVVTVVLHDLGIPVP